MAIAAGVDFGVMGGQIARRQGVKTIGASDEKQHRADGQRRQPSRQHTTPRPQAGRRNTTLHRVGAGAIRQRGLAAPPAGTIRPRAVPAIAAPHRSAFMGDDTPALDVWPEMARSSFRRPAAHPFLRWSRILAAAEIEQLQPALVDVEQHRSAPDSASKRIDEDEMDEGQDQHAIGQWNVDEEPPLERRLKSEMVVEVLLAGH